MHIQPDGETLPDDGTLDLDGFNGELSHLRVHPTKAAPASQGFARVWAQPATERAEEIIAVVTTSTLRSLRPEALIAAEFKIGWVSAATANPLNIMPLIVLERGEVRNPGACRRTGGDHSPQHFEQRALQRWSSWPSSILGLLLLQLRSRRMSSVPCFASWRSR